MAGGRDRGAAVTAAFAVGAVGDDATQALLAVAVGGAALVAVGILGTPGAVQSEALLLNLNELVWASALLPVPVATGIAVTRYRLYDLGRLVSRSVVWALLTAALLTSYLVLVSGVAVLTPAGDDEPAGRRRLDAGGRHAVPAAADPPARRGWPLPSCEVRRCVDLEAFRTAARDLVELEALTEGLLQAGRSTVQPTTVELWLRDRSAAAVSVRPPR